MRKRVKFLIVVSMAFLLSGCIDVTEYVAKDKQGLTSVYLKVGVAKSMMELAKSEGSDSPDPFAAISDLRAEEVFKGMPAGTQMSTEKIDNDFEYGFSLSLAVDLQKQIKQGLIDPSENIPFVPIDRGSKVTIDLPPSESSNSDNLFTDSMMKAFKYRLIIAKSLVPKISRVVVSTKDFDYKPELVSLNEIYLIEMPISYIITGNCQIVLEK